MSLGNRFCMHSYVNSLTFSLEMILLRPFHLSPWACSSPASSSSGCRHLQAKFLQGQLADHQGCSAVESVPFRSLHGRAESLCSTCRSSIASLPQSWSQAGRLVTVTNLTGDPRRSVWTREPPALLVMRDGAGRQTRQLLESAVQCLPQASSTAAKHLGRVGALWAEKKRRAVGIGVGSLLASGSDVCPYIPALCPGQGPGGHSSCGPVLCG